MTSRDFCYWLQGFFEIAMGPQAQPMNQYQVDMVRRHLAMAFKHEIDPSYGDKDAQIALGKIHDSGIVNKLDYPPGIRC